jgi:hypothetical protein
LPYEDYSALLRQVLSAGRNRAREAEKAAAGKPPEKKKDKSAKS